MAGNREPVLRTGGRPGRELIQVYGGLHYLRGNSAPYFSLTWQTWRIVHGRKVEDSAGAAHEEIVKRYPELADLAALHLSDIDGVPMHAAANGFYSLAGALPGNAGEQYHAGNSKRNFQIEPPEGKTWPTTEYREPTPAECLQIFADHCRIPLSQAEEIRARVIAAGEAGAVTWNVNGERWENPKQTERRAAMREEWYRACERMKPRWKAEAEACIAKHKLQVFGDTWPPVEAKSNG